MATPANTFVTYSAKGNREDLTNVISNIDPVNNWCTSNFGSVDATGTLHEWQTDSLETVTSVPTIEGDAFTNSAVTATTRLGNYTQIERKVGAVTDTQEAVSKAGRTSEVAYQKAKILKELSNRIEYAILISTATAAGASGTARQCRGIRGWIQTNTASAASLAATTGNTLSTALNSLLQTIYDAGGNPKYVLGSSATKIRLSGMTANNTRYSTANQKDITYAVDLYKSDFGDLQLIPHRIMSAAATGDMIVLGDLDLWKVAYLRKPKFEELPRTAASTQYAVETEFTLESRNEKGSGKHTCTGA